MLITLTLTPTLPDVPRPIAGAGDGVISSFAGMLATATSAAPAVPAGNAAPATGRSVPVADLALPVTETAGATLAPTLAPASPTNAGSGPAVATRSPAVIMATADGTAAMAPAVASRPLPAAAMPTLTNPPARPLAVAERRQPELRPEPEDGAPPASAPSPAPPLPPIAPADAAAPNAPTITAALTPPGSLPPRFVAPPPGARAAMPCSPAAPRLVPGWRPAIDPRPAPAPGDDEKAAPAGDDDAGTSDRATPAPIAPTMPMTAPVAAPPVSIVATDAPPPRTPSRVAAEPAAIGPVPEARVSAEPAPIVDPARTRIGRENDLPLPPVARHSDPAVVTPTAAPVASLGSSDPDPSPISALAPVLGPRSSLPSPGASVRVPEIPTLLQAAPAAQGQDAPRWTGRASVAAPIQSPGRTAAAAVPVLPVPRAPPGAPIPIGWALAPPLPTPVPGAPPPTAAPVRAEVATALPTRANPALGEPVAPAAIAPATAPAPIPAAAAPVILPALHAFGAAIRQALDDERKPARVAAEPGTPTVAALASTAPVAAAQTADTALDTTDRRWPQAMVQHIERLRDLADETSTRIRLLPDALGPVDVAVRRDGETVHVHFTAASADTRQLLADAQPRLAEAADARGLKLGRADVSGGDLSQGNDRQPAGRQPAPPLPIRPAPARVVAPAADDLDTRLA